MSFDAITALVHSLRTMPEPASLPEALIDADRIALADARSRYQAIRARATEIRRLIDHELADKLEGGALRYGDQIMRTAKHGAHFIVNPELWWDMVTEAVRRSDDAAALLAALYPINSVRLTALPQLAKALDWPVDDIRDNLIDYEPPAISIDSTPIYKAPKWTQLLREGQWSGEKVTEITLCLHGKPIKQVCPTCEYTTEDDRCRNVNHATNENETKPTSPSRSKI